MGNKHPRKDRPILRAIKKKVTFSEREQRKPEEPEGPRWREGGGPEEHRCSEVADKERGALGSGGRGKRSTLRRAVGVPQRVGDQMRA